MQLKALRLQPFTILSIKSEYNQLSLLQNFRAIFSPRNLFTQEAKTPQDLMSASAPCPHPTPGEQ